ncbi:MAG: sulfur carrier protein ThiS [Candidatus Gastranaerophilales bacterium]|nr:sulfur carrier protein ThiS [Candidatus Gastranaerophilales bacterium]
MNIKILLNGHDKELEKELTIQELLDLISYKGKMFVVEKNLDIVHKENYQSEKIVNGDKVEIVSFVGGG